MFGEFEIHDADYSLEQVIDLAEAAEDDGGTAWEAFHLEVDSWVARSPAGLGFGDS